MAVTQEFSQTNITKGVVLTVVGAMLLGLVLYIAYRYSQSRSGNIAIPAGTTYLGSTPTVVPSAIPPTKEAQPPTAPLRFTASADTTWKTHAGNIYPYTFSYPSTLPLVVFPNDPSDSVAISWGNIPAQVNILLNIEFIDKRDANLVGKPKIDYVKNWYKYFSGLKGVASVTRFTNINGLVGFKASYINYANTSPNTDIFFEIPYSPTMMVHLANGVLDPSIFNRMIDSLKWITPTPTLTPTPTIKQ